VRSTQKRFGKDVSFATQKQMKNGLGLEEGHREVTSGGRSGVMSKGNNWEEGVVEL